MDPIRNLVSGADPIRHDPAVPDAEEALRGMLAGTGGYSDRVSPDIPTLAERRQRRARMAGLLTIAAAAVTAGVLVTANLGPLTAAPAPATTVTPTGSPSPATPEPSPTATGTATLTGAPAVPSPAQPSVPVPSRTEAPSQLFTSTAAAATFALPTGWTAKDVPAGTPDFPAAGIEVSDETGKTVATFYHGAGGGLGGSCGPEKYIAAELDAAPYVADWAPQTSVRFSYRVLDQTSVGAGFSYQVGLVDAVSGELKDSCLMYSVVNGAPRGTLSFADRSTKTAGEPVFQTMAEAKAYMGTAEYRKLKEMILSLALTP